MSLFACCLWFSLHLGSYHPDPKYNNDNYGVGLSLDTSEDTRLIVGTYKNSYDDTSYYAGGEYLPFGDRVKWGGMAMWASNYKQHIGVDGLAGFAAEWKISKRARLLVVGIPPYVTSAVLQVRFQ